MSTKTRCPHCGVSIRIPPKVLSRSVACPGCRKTFLCTAPLSTAVKRTDDRETTAPEPPQLVALPIPEPLEEPEGYRCPFCRTRREAVPRQRKTTLGTLVSVAVLLFVALPAMGYILREAASAGHGEVGWPIWGGALAALVVTIALLWLTDRVCGEWVRVCPACKNKVG